MQQGAKICVGIVQDWITLELAVRIHISKGMNDITQAGKDRLRAIFRIVFLVLFLALIAWIITVIVSAHISHNDSMIFIDGFAFGNNICHVYDLMGYPFIGQAVVMSMLVAWLFIETLRLDPFERLEKEFGDKIRWREGRKSIYVYLIVSALFGLSYIGRYIVNEHYQYLYCGGSGD